MISFTHKGDFRRVRKYLNKSRRPFESDNLAQYAQRGVMALASATPIDTGATASSWYYTIEKTHDRITISFNNTNIQNGVPIAIILQYGHGTKNGGYVQGRDYINPAIQPIFDEITEAAWKEVAHR